MYRRNEKQSRNKTFVNNKIIRHLNHTIRFHYRSCTWINLFISIVNINVNNYCYLIEGRSERKFTSDKSYRWTLTKLTLWSGEWIRSSKKEGVAYILVAVGELTNIFKKISLTTWTTYKYTTQQHQQQRKVLYTCLSHSFEL